MAEVFSALSILYSGILVSYKYCKYGRLTQIAHVLLYLFIQEYSKNCLKVGNSQPAIALRGYATR